MRLWKNAGGGLSGRALGAAVPSGDGAEPGSATGCPAPGTKPRGAPGGDRQNVIRRLDASGGYARSANSGEGLSDPSGNQGNAAYDLWEAGFSAAWRWICGAGGDARAKPPTDPARGRGRAARGFARSAGRDGAELPATVWGCRTPARSPSRTLKAARHSLQLTRLRLADGVATDLDVAERRRRWRRSTAPRSGPAPAPGAVDQCLEPVAGCAAPGPGGRVRRRMARCPRP